MIKKTSPLIAVAAGLLILVLGASGLFVIDQTQQALIMRLGAWRATLTEPGLHFKMPLIDTAVFYDKRQLALVTPEEQVLLGDQKRIVVDTFTRFRIADPLKFYQTVRTEANARNQLAAIVQSSMRRVMGTTKMPSILSDDRATIMHTILGDVAQNAKELGIDIVDVRIRRTDLPDETSQAIYERMKTERERQAKQLRAQGYEMAQEIRGKADRDRTVILAEAQRQSQILRGEGDAESNRIYGEAFGQDPKFYAFYRSLLAYKASLGDGTTLVLSPDGDFLKYFSRGPEGGK